MKKDKKHRSYDEIASVGMKILNLVYILLIVVLISVAIYLFKEMRIYQVLVSFLDILMPLFIGFVIAWIFSPLVSKMQKNGIPRIGGSFIVYTGILVAIVIFFSLFVPVIISQIYDFISFLPSVFSNLTEFINSSLSTLEGIGFDVVSLESNLNANITDLYTSLSSSIPQNVVSVAGVFFSGTLDALLSLILGLYILIDFENIKSSMIKLVPTKHQVETTKLFTNIGYEARKTVNGILLIASMVFVCDTIGFAIIGLEASLLIGLFCGLTDLIPYIGPYIGGGVAVVVGFSQGPVIGIGVLIIALLVQAIENYVLQPVVMSKATNIHPIIIMVSLLIFGYFFGIIGMIISTPILSIIKVIVLHFNEKYKIFDYS